MALVKTLEDTFDKPCLLDKKGTFQGNDVEVFILNLGLSLT